jgi:hypothetical protein
MSKPAKNEYMLKKEHVLFNIYVLTYIIDSYSIEYVLNHFSMIIWIKLIGLC